MLFESTLIVFLLWIFFFLILYALSADIILLETHLVYFRSDNELKVENKYWSSEISLINNSYPSEDYRSLQTLDSHPFLPSLWRYSGDRWMEILWTEMRVRGEECPFLWVSEAYLKGRDGALMWSLWTLTTKWLTCDLWKDGWIAHVSNANITLLMNSYSLSFFT